MLINDEAGRRYVGQTSDLDRRLMQHNGAEPSGPSRYTAKFPGIWRLAHSEEFASRSEAMARERWFKSGVGRAWLDEHVGRAGPPRAD
ncbi:GIY-YIG nuclease family protein [Pseudobythopirellula maris]|uniref:GIY-YIG nuclease family protein n=1 Tax=Pseudobythopirellula maris TaxID=2527991 RepID=UPI0018D34662